MTLLCHNHMINACKSRDLHVMHRSFYNLLDCSTWFHARNCAFAVQYVLALPDTVRTFNTRIRCIHRIRAIIFSARKYADIQTNQNVCISISLQLLLLAGIYVYSHTLCTNTYDNQSEDYHSVDIYDLWTHISADILQDIPRMEYHSSSLT
jgi:hypothetical protein